MFFGMSAAMADGGKFVGRGVKNKQALVSKDHYVQIIT